MNYDFLLDVNEPILLLEDVKLNESTRPQVGQTICLPGSSQTYDIVRSSPTSNPATQKVQYFVLPHKDRLETDRPLENTFLL